MCLVPVIDAVESFWIEKERQAVNVPVSKGMSCLKAYGQRAMANGAFCEKDISWEGFV